MIVPRIVRRVHVQFVPSRSRSTFSSISYSLSSASHRPTIGAALFRPCSQHRFHHDSQINPLGGDNILFLSFLATSTVAGISFLSASSSSSSQTLCESIGNGKIDGEANLDKSMEVEPHTEPEIDPYDNLPDKDEPTHCSICLTYRQGPCRPYWRKVEACTKDGEKEMKEKDEGGRVSGEPSGEHKDDRSDDSSSPMSESTRCFKYMMPWIDCASRYRNLYTLIEMDINYTEGIEELEATSRHLCWVPGQEPKIDWSGWQHSSIEDEDKEATVITTTTDGDSTSNNSSNVALWKTIDPALGDPKLITIEAQVPTTVDSGLGILECAYAVDQDNNVIGFAYGTKPSDLIANENKKEDDNQNAKAVENKEKENEKNERGADNSIADKGENEKNMVTLNIRLLASRTQNFTLSASYTHRIERVTSSNGGVEKPISLESHLYKSKPFDLASIPRVMAPTSTPQATKDDIGSQENHIVVT